MNPPEVEGFEEYQAFMEERGIKARQVYHPVVEVDGQLLGGYWAIVIRKEGLLPDGRLWQRGSEITNELLKHGFVQGWQLQADLLLSEFDEDMSLRSVP